MESVLKIIKYIYLKNITLKIYLKTFICIGFAKPGSRGEASVVCTANYCRQIHPELGNRG
jgi:Ni,Fe-hydrogenase I cytochrome b subunit